MAQKRVQRKEGQMSQGEMGKGVDEIQNEEAAAGG